MSYKSLEPPGQKFCPAHDKGLNYPKLNLAYRNLPFSVSLDNFLSNQNKNKTNAMPNKVSATNSVALSLQVLEQ